MNFLTKLLIITVIAAISSCTPNERNDIEFIDTYKSVQDSIIKLNSFFDKKDGLKRYYYDINNKLFIINHRYGKIKDSLKLNNINAQEKQISNLTNYLKRNGISCGYRDNIFDIVHYCYNLPELNEFAYLRYILYWPDLDRPLPSNSVERFEILDRKGDLILVKPIDKRDEY